MTVLPIDSIPVWCPTWADIAGKAHLYKTARIRATGEYVGLVRVAKYIDGNELAEPVFVCRVPKVAGFDYRKTRELCAFCL